MFTFTHLLAAFVGFVVGWIVVCLIVNAKIRTYLWHIYNLQSELFQYRLSEGKDDW